MTAEETRLLQALRSRGFDAELPSETVIVRHAGRRWRLRFRDGGKIAAYRRRAGRGIARNAWRFLPLDCTVDFMREHVGPGGRYDSDLIEDAGGAVLEIPECYWLGEREEAGEEHDAEGHMLMILGEPEI